MTHRELAERGYDALNRGDFDALRELITPDFVLERPPGLGTVSGRDAAVAFAEPDAFDWQRFEPVGDVVERGDTLLIQVRVRARGAGSDVEIEQAVFHVATLREGRIARLEIHFDRDDAIRAFEGRK